MNPVNTQIATYSPDCVPDGESDCGQIACMFHDFEGYWVFHSDHLIIVENLQKRITYLENCLDEANEMLCR